MNSFIDHFFETGVQRDRKLQFNNRMPFHSYSVIWDSWQEGFSAGTHIPAKDRHVLLNLSEVAYLPVY